MVMAAPERITIEKKSWLGYVAAFILHTYVAYTCATHLSEWLVFHWFGWVVPIMHVFTRIPATDWYLQHFELMTIVPALLVGYLNVARFLPNTIRTFMHEGHHSIATWAWIFPTLVLLYRMLEYHSPSSSVLYGSSITEVVRYFFDIVKVMPTWQNLLAGDPIRALAQMSVTAPFYAGVAYSLGALASKYQLLTKLFTFEKQGETTTPKEPEPAPHASDAATDLK
jgi:hypothetical protein